MRLVLTAVLLTCSLSVVADESPYDKFSAKNNFTNGTKVTWIQVDNILKSCNAENVRRRLPQYNVPIDGCSFWDKSLFGNTCVIFTPKNTDYWTMGHELRHCFQGQFHE